MSLTLDSPHTIDPSTLRRALGRIPTSVSVVTAAGDDGPIGMTVGSLTSVSSDPPLVAFFALASSHTFTQLRTVDHFCINVLAEDQGEMCFGFASRNGAKFDIGRWERCCSDAPRVHGAAAWIECTRESVFEAGDHLGMMGRVSHVEYSDNRPLVFHRGKLSRLHPGATRDISTTRLDWWAL
ncbi:flavin reductase family protein [Rhodococcus opacus]|uniref:flavin reductase family protein n=1 Tax=Rhodococcus opacus TaxID=37919 RepID=UPI00223583B5|nr:flavin reductase family protein [Rhodococcus opacus]UZG59668.1 flavin reductase family protein [Rhodococcus opacus]